MLVGWRYTYVLVERHAAARRRRASASIAAVWATPIAWYAVTQPFYQHGLAFRFVAVLVEYWDAHASATPSWRRMLLLGLLGGVGMMMRAAGGAVAAPARLSRRCGTSCAGRERRRWLVGGVVLCAAALLAFSPQMLVWHYYTGSPLQPAQVEPLRPTTPFLVVIAVLDARRAVSLVAGRLRRRSSASCFAPARGRGG